MKDILYLYSLFGLNFDDTASTFVLFCAYFMFCSGLCLLCVVNIVVYAVSIYIASNEKILSKIPSKYGYIHKLLNYYKNIRIFLILIEVIILLFSLCVIIYLNYILISPFIHIN